MHLTPRFLDSLSNAPGFDREAFEAVHRSGEQVTSIRINPAKSGDEWKAPGAGQKISTDLHYDDPLLIEHSRIPWTRYGYYLERRPSFTFDPLFHAGSYYVQEASSMFLEQAFTQTVDTSKDIRVLDLCAAPGGKSTHLQSLMTAGSLLVSNEVIRARAGILRQNLVKWGAANTIVTSNDPQHFSRLESFFDVIVADAPCSGSGLFRRDPDAFAEWSPEAVQLCCGRQQRILADVLPSLKEGGILIYSTCSYSMEEDELVLDKLVREHPLESISLNVPFEWHIVETEAPVSGAKGYRFYPDKLRGEGFFLACLQKTSGRTPKKSKAGKPDRATAREEAVLKEWVNTEGHALVRHNESILALPESQLFAFVDLQSALYIQSAGTLVGSCIRDKVVPDHALAMSPLLSENIPSCGLDQETAIRYLQRQDISIDTPVKGWQVMQFRGRSLGWINALPNRINNYYPKELRILKQGPGLI